MKKIISFFALVFVIFAFSACGSDGSNQTGEGTPVVAEEPSTPSAEEQQVTQEVNEEAQELEDELVSEDDEVDLGELI